jgi:hypothetical protein
MADWRTELEQELSQVEDQRSPMKEHPLYPVVLAALEEVKQELSKYGIEAVVEGSHGQGGKLGIWAPDMRELKFFVQAHGQTISIQVIHTRYLKGFFPFARCDLDSSAGITKDLVASEIVKVYLDFLKGKFQKSADKE